MKAILLAAVIALATSHAHAQVKKPQLTGNLVNDVKANFEQSTGVKATGDLGFDLTKALDAKLLPDLQYALKLAQATNSTVTAPCWQAWIDMINTQETAVKDQAGNEIPVPDPHIVTSFERLVELRNALQPESKFMVSCSPVASMVKTDILGFMGKVIGGGAALTTLVPGL